MPRVWALIPASGVGARMGSVMAKQYLPIAGKTILEHTLNRIGACPSVDKMMLAIAAKDKHFAALDYQHPKLHQVLKGGEQRADSVRKLLQALVAIDPQAWALVHDAVRPGVRVDDIEHLVQTAADKGHGGILAAPITDTVKQATEDNKVANTLPRSQLWRAFTPQLFRANELLTALENCADATDEASAIESAGGTVFLLEGSPDNLKITRPADLALAELILAAQAG